MNVETLSRDMAAVQERLKDLGPMKEQLSAIHTAVVKMSAVADKIVEHDKKFVEHDKEIKAVQAKVHFAHGGVKALLVGIPIIGAVVTFFTTRGS